MIYSAVGIEAVACRRQSLAKHPTKEWSQ